MHVQDPIKKPIIRTESKLVKKEASEIFKFIQMYMGDRSLLQGKSSGVTPFSIAVDVVCRGWTNVALRDEIYIQLCRQTTRNPLPSVALFLYFSQSCLAAGNWRPGAIVKGVIFSLWSQQMILHDWVSVFVILSVL